MKIIDNLFCSLYLFFDAIDDGRPGIREICLLASNKITHDSEYKSFKPAAYSGKVLHAYGGECLQALKTTC